MGSIDSGLYQFTFFWLVTAPVFALLHELGHALAALPFTNGPVIASIGNPGVPARELALGRLRIHVRPFSTVFGRAEYGGGASETQTMLISAAGPVVSLALAVMLTGILRTTEFAPGWLNETLAIARNGAALQTLSTALPVRYPSWFGSYAGRDSDGRKILNILRARSSR